MKKHRKDGVMEIIKCNCGYYKLLDDELCPNCKADYSLGAKYEVLADQETAAMRWVNLGEKGFNDYMNQASQPHYMSCPKCGFKMLITETQCPHCGIPVKFKGIGYQRIPLIVKIALFATAIAVIYALLPAIIQLIGAIILLFK